MKKILLFCTFVFILTFSFCYNTLAFNIDIPVNEISNEIVVENSTQPPTPIITEVSPSQKNELLTPTNIINIILIIVGIVLILLGIAILIRCK